MTVDEEFNNAQEMLDNFEQIHNVRPPFLPNDAIEAMELNYEELTKLTADECANYSYILEQYSLYLQRVINKEKATLSWLNNKLENSVCGELNNLGEYHKYSKYEIKVKVIAKGNSVVQNLISQINFTQRKIERLEYIPTSIKAIAKALSEIRQTKMYRSQ